MKINLKQENTIFLTNTFTLNIEIITIYNLNNIVQLEYKNNKENMYKK